MTTISLKLPEELLREIEREAAARGIGKSALIRDSLERTLRKRVAKRTPSCLDLVSDLVGQFDGPADASTSRRYLDEAIRDDHRRGKKNHR